MFEQFIDGQIKHLDMEPGADFATAIQAIQLAGRSYVEHKKVPSLQRQNWILQFKNELIKDESQLTQLLKEELGYTSVDAQREMQQALNFISPLLLISTENLNSPSLGPCLIYGSWSSPIQRFCQTALTALLQGNSILWLSEPSASKIYSYLAQLLKNAGAPNSLCNCVSSTDKETLETLFSHPSIRAIHFVGHYYEGEFVRSLSFDSTKKRKYYFGGHNPVVFLNDAPLDSINETFKSSLQFHVRSEDRFHRWFVQEKVYPQLLEKVKELASSLTPEVLGKSPNTQYSKNYILQMQNLSKEKSWLQQQNTSLEIDGTLSVQIATDFNNCSPWQQSEVLGPVLTITRFKNIPEAVKFVNTTQFASAAAVYSSSSEKFMEISKQLHMPRIALNKLPLLESDSATHASYESGVGNEVSDLDFFTYKKVHASFSGTP